MVQWTKKTVILQGDFKWVHRSRIRITLFGQNGTVPQATDLHENSFQYPVEPTGAESLSELDSKKYKTSKMFMVPYLALNEVCNELFPRIPCWMNDALTMQNT